MSGKMTLSGQVALVTGASSGIGLEIAHVLAAKGCDLVLHGRDEARLAALRTDLLARYGSAVHVIAADLALSEERERVCTAVAALGLHIDILVNNAGFGLHGRAERLSRVAQLSMIEVNVAALTDLALRFLPAMRRRGHGYIMNVASVAGFVPGPHMAVYYATKAFVVSFSQALDKENEEAGVRVCALCPGPTSTDFGRRAGFSNAGVVDAYGAMSARDVADEGVRRMLEGERTIITGWRNRMAVLMAGFLPRWLVLRVLEKAQRQRGEP